MMSDAYRRGLPIALERGSVTLEEIDAAVRRVLILKERLGLFEDPYRRGAKPDTAAALAKRRRLAREVGSRSLVLLKNESDTLPLAAVHTLALIGPLANAGPEMGGPWGEPRQGLRQPCQSPSSACAMRMSRSSTCFTKPECRHPERRRHRRA